MVSINLKPLNKVISISFQNKITIEELYIKLRSEYNLEQNIEEWICFSETRRKKLNNNDYLEEQVDQKLIIFTYTSKSPIKDQFRNHQEITLYLNIEYNFGTKTINRQFSNTTTYQDIKELALAECGLLFEPGAEIVIRNFGQLLYTLDEKSYTIEKMRLRNNGTLDINIINKNSEMLNQLSSLSEKEKQIKELIPKYLKNIKFKVDVIIKSTFEQLNQLLQNIEENIDQAQKGVDDISDSNQIDNLSIQIHNINIYIQNLEFLINKQTEKIIEDSQQILCRYNTSSIQIHMQPTCTIMNLIEQLSSIDIVNIQLITKNQQSQLRFSNNQINQLNLEDKIGNFVNHTLYLDSLKIQIRYSFINKNIIEVQVFY